MRRNVEEARRCGDRILLVRMQLAIVSVAPPSCLRRDDIATSEVVAVLCATVNIHLLMSPAGPG